MKTSEASKTYRANRRVKNMWLAMAMAGGALACGSLSSGSRVAGATTLLVVSILITVWMRRAALVSLFETYLEMKFAPLAPLKRVHYHDIRKVETVGKNKAQLTYDDGSREKSLKIPLNMLSPGDSDSLLQFLAGRRDEFRGP